MEKSYNFSEMLRPLIKLVVGIIALIFIKILMAIAIPSFDEGAPGVLAYIGTVGNLAVNTLILLLLLNFGREGKNILNKVTEEKYFGDIILFTMAIIATGLAHWVYKDVFSLLLGKNLYIYSLIFLAVAATLIIIFGVRIYKNLDKISGFLLEKIKSIPDIIRKIEREDITKK